MKHRKLRIAWSVAWGVVAAILAAVCLLSYFHVATLRISSRYEIEAFQGWLILNSTIGNLALTRSGVIGRIWIPCVASTVLLAAPWVPWSTRFSLRALLIATTLVAVVLGLIVWATRAR